MFRVLTFFIQLIISMRMKDEYQDSHDVDNGVTFDFSSSSLIHLRLVFDQLGDVFFDFSIVRKTQWASKIDGK